MSDFLPLVAIANQFIDEAVRFDRMSNGRTWEIARRAREISTVKLCSHRRAGHTTAVNELASAATMIIVPTKVMKANYSTRYVVPASMIAPGTCKPEGHDMIIIDMATLLSRQQIDRIYDNKFLEAAFPHNVLPMIVMFQ